MSTQFTVDDYSSFQCFCGTKHCCCRWLHIQMKPSTTNILHELKLEEERQSQNKQSQVRQIVERRRNRKAIFDKKEYQLSQLQKSDKKTLSIGSSQNLPLQPLLQTKLTFKKNLIPFTSRTHTIFGSSNDVHNNTTIIFDPIQQSKQQVSIDLNSFQQNQQNVQGFISSNESKLMLEQFLESDLFQSVPQKPFLSHLDRTLPQIMQRYGEMASFSICIEGISQYKIHQQKHRLSECIDEGLKLSEKLLIAVEEIHRYLNSKQLLLSQFDINNFLNGEWIPNWERLSILLPKQDFTPQNKDILQSENCIKFCQGRLQQAKQLLIKQTNIQVYMAIRDISTQSLVLFKCVCQDLYMNVRNNRINDNYQTAYKLYTQDLTQQESKSRIKQSIKEREMFVAKLEFMKDCHDRIWSNSVGQLIKDKITKDIRLLKTQYYKKP